MNKATIALVVLGSCISAAWAGGPSQSTPEETARGFKEAAANQNWKQAFAYLTQKAKADMVGGAFMGAAYSSQSDTALAASFGELVEKHDLADRNNRDLREAENLDDIFVELVDWIENNLPSGGARNAFANTAEQMAATEFSEFEIDGDQASANMVGPERTRRVTFRNIDGRWFMET